MGLPWPDSPPNRCLLTHASALVLLCPAPSPETPQSLSFHVSASDINVTTVIAVKTCVTVLRGSASVRNGQHCNKLNTHTKTWCTRYPWAEGEEEKVSPS